MSPGLIPPAMQVFTLAPIRHMWGLFYFLTRNFPKNLDKIFKLYTIYNICLKIFSTASGVFALRVISGQARGRKLLAPEGLDTRPTTDRVKESMFNLLMPYLPCNKVLDLFAGSGALGIEALSRGSQYGIFIEADKAAVRIVKKNLELARQTDKAQVVEKDAFAFLSGTSTVFDTIFLDPPYNQGLIERSLRLISERGILAPDGVIVAECEYGGEVPGDEYFKTVKSARYGKTNVFILKNHTL